MYAYISRRERWYDTLNRLDDKFKIPDVLLADSLLEHSRPSRQDRIAVVTPGAADKLPNKDLFEHDSRALQK